MVIFSSISNTFNVINIMHDVDNVEKWLHACNLQYYLLQVLWLSVPAMSRQNWVRAPFFCTCEIALITIWNDDDNTAGVVQMIIV